MVGENHGGEGSHNYECCARDRYLTNTVIFHTSIIPLSTHHELPPGRNIADK